MMRQMNYLNLSDYQQKMKLNPFVKYKRVVLTSSAKKNFDDIISRSSLLNSEIGGIACYDINNNHVTIRNFHQITNSISRADSFKYNKDALTHSSKVRCAKEIPIIFHTHSTKKSPSIQDRLNTVINKNMGCILSKNNIICYVGEYTIPTNSIL